MCSSTNLRHICKINALEYCSLATKTYPYVKAKNVLIMAEYAMFGRCFYA
jgi:hypothetical protein